MEFCIKALFLAVVVNVLYTQESNGCSVNQFMCSDGECINKNWRCDGYGDCSDGSDESGCDANTCRSDQFKCSSGACIDKDWRCDGQNYCKDGSDELGCENNTCATYRFRCRYGGCIHKFLRCDGTSNCKDDSDEIGCESSTTRQAESSTTRQAKSSTTRQVALVSATYNQPTASSSTTSMPSSNEQSTSIEQQAILVSSTTLTTALVSPLSIGLIAGLLAAVCTIVTMLTVIVVWRRRNKRRSQRVPVERQEANIEMENVEERAEPLYEEIQELPNNDLYINPILDRTSSCNQEYVDCDELSIPEYPTSRQDESNYTGLAYPTTADSHLYMGLTEQRNQLYSNVDNAG